MVWESLYLSLSFLFVEVKPINTNHFKVKNSAAFSTLTALYNHRLGLVPKHFHPPKGSPTAGSCHSRLFHALWQPPTCFVPPWSACSGYCERNEQAKCKCGRGENPGSLLHPLSPFLHLGAQAVYKGSILVACLLLIEPVASSSEIQLPWVWPLPLAAARILVLDQAWTFVTALHWPPCFSLGSQTLLAPFCLVHAVRLHPGLSSQSPMGPCPSSLTSYFPHKPHWVPGRTSLAPVPRTCQLSIPELCL